ncbi:MAG TPA: BBP7 family outer membrane beta-barrel protein [Gemmatales bacterium]|nr:BBP7 family outer membrane beta-barrel protein [Gemmatales bacterium]HMP61292.1 BBP7 family outer membrane beta-barrel protein [Gemmatales bacterium]
MAKRWIGGMLFGAWIACSTPSGALAQVAPTDPVPLARSEVMPAGGLGPWPGAEAGVVPAQYGMPGPMGGGMPLPPMGGGPGCMPPFAPPAHNAPFLSIGGSDPSCAAPLCNQFFVSFGWRMMQRGGFNERPFIVLDPASFDRGGPPIPGSPSLFDLNDVPMPFNHGFQAAIGFFDDCNLLWTFEGFYVPNRGTARVVENTSRLTSFFYNAPLGFEGSDGFLWGNADVMAMTYRNNLANAEVNVRYMKDYKDGFNFVFLAGLRYFDIYERFDYLTGDEQVRFNPDPETIANLSWRTQNRLAGGQLGFGFNTMLTSWFGVSWDSKVGVFANTITAKNTLTRGDGFQAFDESIQFVKTTSLYDTSLYFTIQNGMFRLKGGYNMMWIVGTSKADNQVDFDLATQPTRLDSLGTMFFHGPSVMLEIIF